MATDGFFGEWLEAWRSSLKQFTPYPVVTADKLACLHWQHLLYVTFIAFEAACGSELIPSEETPGVLKCREGEISLDPTSTGQQSWVSTFGLEDSPLGCPAITPEFATLQVSALQRFLAEPNQKLLGLLEKELEEWLDDQLAPDWNIYLELAELGELSEESSTLLERIQRRLAVFRRKTIRSHLSHSKPAAPFGSTVSQPKSPYIRRQTRRKRLQQEIPLQQKKKPHPQPVVEAPASVTASEQTPDSAVEVPQPTCQSTEEGSEC
jgi:hypothetical protein